MDFWPARRQACGTINHTPIDRFEWMDPRLPVSDSAVFLRSRSPFFLSVPNALPTGNRMRVRAERRVRCHRRLLYIHHVVR